MNINSSLKNKVAVVTGSSRGIGAQIARQLAESGCHVVVQYLNQEEKAMQLVKDFMLKDVKAVAIKLHLGDQKSRASFWQEFDQHFSHLDFFVSNAAIGVFKPIQDLSINSLQKVLAVNVEAFLDMSQSAIKRMEHIKKVQFDDHNNITIKSGSLGRVVALSSLGAERAIANYGSIGASKAALESLVRQFAREIGPKGINFNTVRAGLVDTGILRFSGEQEKIISETIAQTPCRQLTETTNVADLVMFLLSEQSSMINGQTLMVDGGFNIYV